MRLTHPTRSITPSRPRTQTAYRTPHLKIAGHECAAHSLAQRRRRSSALACILIFSQRPNRSVSDGLALIVPRNALTTPAPEQALRTRRRARTRRTRSAAARRTPSALTLNLALALTLARALTLALTLALPLARTLTPTLTLTRRTPSVTPSAAARAAARSRPSSRASGRLSCARRLSRALGRRARPPSARLTSSI